MEHSAENMQRWRDSPKGFMMNASKTPNCRWDDFSSLDPNGICGTMQVAVAIVDIPAGTELTTTYKNNESMSGEYKERDLPAQRASLLAYKYSSEIIDRQREGEVFEQLRRARACIHFPTFFGMMRL